MAYALVLGANCLEVGWKIPMGKMPATHEAHRICSMHTKVLILYRSTKFLVRFVASIRRQHNGWRPAVGE